MIALPFIDSSTMSSFSQKGGITSPFAETVLSVEQGELPIDQEVVRDRKDGVREYLEHVGR